MKANNIVIRIVDSFVYKDIGAADYLVEAELDGKITRFLYQIDRDGDKFLGKPSSPCYEWEDNDFPLSYDLLLSEISTFIECQ